jgi:hypothetical protein
LRTKQTLHHLVQHLVQNQTPTHHYPQGTLIED